jgi:two-component system, cell cycle sensor histidine kinase and response regulator CckA
MSSAAGEVLDSMPPEIGRRRRISWLIALLGGLLVVALAWPGGDPLQSLAASPVAHLTAELAAVVIALLIVGVVWNSYSQERAGNIILIACGLLVSAILDFGHALAFPGMPELGGAASLGKATDLWLATQLVAGTTFVAVALRPWRPLARPGTRWALLIGGCIVAGVVAWLGLTQSERLPATYAAGAGLTGVAIAGEAVVVGMFALSALLFLSRTGRAVPYDAVSLYGAMAISAIAEISLTFEAEPAGRFFVLGHLSRVIAYVLIYRAMFVSSVREPFDRVVLAEAELRRANRQREALLANLPSAVVVHDSDARVAYANPDACQFLGKAAAELVGRVVDDPAWGFLREDSVPMALSEYPARRVVDSGQPLAGIVVGVARVAGAEPRWALVNAFPEVDDAGVLRQVVVAFMDITERFGVERVQERLAAIVESSDDAIIAKTLGGTILSWNRGAEGIYGYPASEVIGRSIEVLSPEDRPSDVVQILARVAAGERVERYETVRRRRDGELVDVSLTVSPLRDSSGAVIGASTIAHDITVRKRAEAALRAGEARYRDLFENTLVPIWDEDFSSVREYLGDVDLPAGVGPAEYLRAHPEIVGRCAELVRIRSANRAAVELHQAESAAELLGDLTRIFPPGATEALELELEAVWTGGAKVVTDADVNTLRGEVRHVALSWNVAPGHEATYDRVIVVTPDITERVTAEEALRASEERYREFVNDDMAGVAITEPGGRLLACNPAYASMHGFPSVEAAIGIDVTDLYFDPDERDRLLAELRSTGRVNRRETTHRRVDGTPVHLIQTAIAEYDAAGELVSTRSYQVDVTERRRLEEQLRQSQKMEAIGRLAGGIAHDFNNLLTAINGYADFLALDLAEDDPRRADVQEIRNAGGRAASLTRQLLAFSRRQVLQPVVLDLNAVVVGLAPMLRRLIGEQIDFRAVRAPHLGHVQADPAQIEQVILNLALNARDAMPHGGAMTISTANVELNAEDVRARPAVSPGSYVMLEVSDTGVGMDAETVARVFEPFFTTKELGEGTGLGLATVDGIVAQSGGHVVAQSEPGRGSVFRVYLPCVAAPLGPRSDTAPGAAEGGTETLLLVEDEAAVRLFAARILRSLGYSVLVAGNATEALAIASAAPAIDLLVTDVMLPGLNGPALAARLRERRPNLPTLYVSGYAEEAIVHQGLLESGVAFLGKPFTNDALARAIRDALAGPTNAVAAEGADVVPAAAAEGSGRP